MMDKMARNLLQAQELILETFWAAEAGETGNAKASMRAAKDRLSTAEEALDAGTDTATGPSDWQNIFTVAGRFHAPRDGDEKRAKLKIPFGGHMEAGTTALRARFTWTPSEGTLEGVGTHTIGWIHNADKGKNWWGNALLYGVWNPGTGVVKMAHNYGLEKPRNGRPELGQADGFIFEAGRSYGIELSYEAAGKVTMTINGEVASQSDAAWFSPFGAGAWFLAFGNPEGDEKHRASIGAAWSDLRVEVKRA
jgi:hypothetical protein